eukprot:UN12610
MHQKYVLLLLIDHQVHQQYVLFVKIGLVSMESSHVTYYYHFSVTSSN